MHLRADAVLPPQASASSVTSTSWQHETAGGSTTAHVIAVTEDGDARRWGADDDDGSLTSNGRGGGAAAATTAGLGRSAIDAHAHPVTPGVFVVATPDGCAWVTSGGSLGGGSSAVTTRRFVVSSAGAAVTSVRWSPDGAHFAAGAEDGGVSVWAAADGARASTPTVAPRAIQVLRWAPTGGRLLFAAGSELGIARAFPAPAVGIGTALAGADSSVRWPAHAGVVLAADWAPACGASRGGGGGGGSCVDRVVSGGEDGV